MLVFVDLRPVDHTVPVGVQDVEEALEVGAELFAGDVAVMVEVGRRLNHAATG